MGFDHDLESDLCGRVKEALYELIISQLTEKEKRKGQKRSRASNLLGKRIRDSEERGRRESLSPSSKILDGLLLGSGGKRSHMGGTVMGSGWGSAAPVERLSLGQYIGLNRRTFDLLVHFTEDSEWEESMASELELWWPSRPMNGGTSRDQWLVAEVEAALLLLHVSSHATSLVTCFWRHGKPLFDRITLAAIGSPAERLWLNTIVAVEEWEWQKGLECPFGRVDELLSTEVVRLIRKEEAGRSLSLYHVRRASRMRDTQRILRSEIIHMYREACEADSDDSPEKRLWKTLLQSIVTDDSDSENGRRDLLPALLQELPVLVLNDEHVFDSVYSGLGASVDRMGAALESAVGGGTDATVQLDVGVMIIIDAFARALQSKSDQLSAFVKRFWNLFQSFLVSIATFSLHNETKHCEPVLNTTSAVRLALRAQQNARIHEEYFLEALSALASVEIGRSLLFSRHRTSNHVTSTPPRTVDIRPLKGIREGKVIEVVTPVAIASFWVKSQARDARGPRHSLSSFVAKSQHMESVLSLLVGNSSLTLMGRESLTAFVITLLDSLARNCLDISDTQEDRLMVVSNATGFACWVLGKCPLLDWVGRGNQMATSLLQLLQSSLSGANVTATNNTTTNCRGSIDDYLQAAYNVAGTLQTLVVERRKSERGSPAAVSEGNSCVDIGQSIVDIMASNWRLFAQKIPALIDAKGSALAGTTVDLSTATVQRLSGTVLFLLFDTLGVKLRPGLRVARILPELPSSSTESTFEWGLWRAIHTLFLSTQAFVTTSKMVVEGMAYLLEGYQGFTSLVQGGEELTRWLRTAYDALKETDIAELQKRLLRVLGAMMYNDSCLTAILGEPRLLLQILKMLRNNHSLAVRRNASIAIDVLFTQACCLPDDLAPADELLFFRRRLKGLEAAVTTHTVPALIQFAVRPKYNKDGFVTANALEAIAALLWDTDKHSPQRDEQEKFRAALVEEASNASTGILKVLNEEDNFKFLAEEDASNALEQLAVVMVFLLPVWVERSDALAFARALVKLLEAASASTNDNFIAVIDLGCASCNYPALHSVLSQSPSVTAAARAAAATAQAAATSEELPDTTTRHLLKRCKRLLVKLQ